VFQSASGGKAVYEFVDSKSGNKKTAINCDCVNTGGGMQLSFTDSAGFASDHPCGSCLAYDALPPKNPDAGFAGGYPKIIGCW